MGAEHMKYMSLVLIVFSPLLFAETYLCRGDAGAGVENGGPAGIQSLIYDVSKFQLRLSNERGHWSLTENNDASPIFEHCESQYRCMPEEGFFGVFYMTKSHVFTYVIQKAYGHDLSWQILYSIKGRCELINEGSY